MPSETWYTGTVNSTPEKHRVCISCKKSKPLSKFCENRRRCNQCRFRSQRERLAHPRYTGKTCSRCSVPIAYWNESGLCLLCRKLIPKIEKPCEACGTPFSTTVNSTRRWCDACKEGSNYNRLRSYKLSKAELDRMLDEQGKLCAICKERPPTVVDHDHESGAVRALLCNRCNTALGAVEIPGWLEQAKVYLDGWRSKAPASKRADPRRFQQRVA
jgi:hypothetical protein